MPITEQDWNRIIKEQNIDIHSEEWKQFRIHRCLFLSNLNESELLNEIKLFKGEKDMNNDIETVTVETKEEETVKATRNKALPVEEYSKWFDKVKEIKATGTKIKDIEPKIRELGFQHNFKTLMTKYFKANKKVA